MALLTLAIVILRYGFNAGSILAQESVMYMHALVFMLGIPYALQTDEHVRVDVVYGRLSPVARARINLAGHCLLLMPVAATLLWLSLPYVGASWRILEGSPEVGGIPAVFVLKSLIPLASTLLLLQGLACAIAALRTIRTGPDAVTGSPP